MTTPQRLIVSTLSLTSLGLGIFAYSEHTARLAAEARLLAASAEDDRSSTVAAAPVPDAEPAPESVPPVPDAAEAQASAVQAPPTEVRTGTPAFRGRAAEFTAMMESPEILQLINLRARGALDGRYADLFKALRLPPEQLDRLQQLLVDKQNTMRDVMAAMRSQGLQPGRDNSDEMRALVQNANSEIDAQILAEIGDAAFAQYQTYERTQPQRAVVDRVQQRLSYTDQPLTDQQAASLVQVLAANTPAPAGTGGAASVRPFFSPGSGTITTQAIEQARGILAPSQIAALETLQREQEAQAELMRRTRRNAGPRPATGQTR